jgi:hypothetical protein
MTLIIQANGVESIKNVTAGKMAKSTQAHRLLVLRVTVMTEEQFHPFISMLCKYRYKNIYISHMECVYMSLMTKTATLHVVEAADPSGKFNEFRNCTEGNDSQQIEVWILGLRSVPITFLKN